MLFPVLSIYKTSLFFGKMTTITCTKCYKSLDQFLFINKKDDFYKRCITCREQNNEYTSKRKKQMKMFQFLVIKN